MICPTAIALNDLSYSHCIVSSAQTTPSLIQVMICCWQVLLSTTVELLLLNYMYQRNQCLQNKEFSAR